MSQITEWEFTADVASQINEILKERVDLPFSEAKCEQRRAGTIQRRDLTLLNRANKAVFTGEVKMPDKRDGRSPFNESAVIDAHNKANAIGVEYFFTWNVNDCILWRTFEPGKPITERDIEPIRALNPPIAKSDDLLNPRVKEQVRSFLKKLLERCAAILSGEKPLARLPLDEKFIKVWELALMPIVRDTLFAVNTKFNSDKAFRIKLEKWMREEQGWTLSNEEEKIRENLERAANPHRRKENAEVSQRVGKQRQTNRALNRRRNLDGTHPAAKTFYAARFCSRKCGNRNNQSAFGKSKSCRQKSAAQ
ncbi:hypothetical protein BH24ACI2_BH24ACI2_10660 [soil metagenome]